MDAWYSGLLPYPILLPAQFAILVLMFSVSTHFSRGQGRFVGPNALAGRILLGFGSAYLAAIVIRYVVRMSIHPDERWTGGATPIIFHCVLAGFVLLVGHYHLQNSAGEKSSLRPTPRPWRWWLSWAAFPTTMTLALGLVPLFRSLDVSLANAPYLAVAVVAGIVVALEALIPYRRSWAPDWTAIRNDALFLGAIGMLLPFGLSWFVVSVASPYLGSGSTALAALWPHQLGQWTQLALMLVSAELLRYWLHVAAHNIPVLWRLHAIHHSPDKLYWLNVGRFHPLEKALQFLLDALGFIILGVPEDVLALYFVFYATNGFFQHSNIDARYGVLNYLVSSAELHRWHHSRRVEESNNNYGNNLIVWDLVFRTWFLPPDRHVGRLGLTNPNYPAGFFRQMSAPFNRDPNQVSGGQDAF
jgi:sterol desaturase/sphingolipid hydroxylase (fatty acid hydroxylase superfamily)